MTDHRSDQDLLVLTHAGDREAAAALYVRYAHRLRLFARTVLHDEFLAADVVQCVFVKILQLKRKEVKSIRDPLAWLIRSTRNEALNLLRTDSRARARAAVHASMRTAVDIDRSAVSGDGGELLDHLDRLKGEQRELIVLKHLVGMTFDQLAETLGENRSTLASRYRGAMETLRELVEKGGGGAIGGAAGGRGIPVVPARIESVRESGGSP